MQVWQQLFSFLTSANSSRIVFLSEGRHQWVHLGSLVRAVADCNTSLTYLTSSIDDPGLNHRGEFINPVFVGSGLARTITLRTLNADLLITSIPDLGDVQFRRSRRRIHYVYVHHSLVSTHMIYREEAFDQFDTVFCAGPHHIAETRAREQLCGLPSKTLFEFGYPRLDYLIEAAKDLDQETPNATPHVLVAPSWGPTGLFETIGADLVGLLLESGMLVTARPHPETRRRTPHCLDDIEHRFGSSANFTLAEDILTDDALLGADIMISDWSGVALEYAFARERPVLFVDMGRKILNPNYTNIGMEPVEVTIRERIGELLPITDIASVPGRIRTMLENTGQWRKEISKVRSELVFNLGSSTEFGVKQLLNMIKSNSPAGYKPKGDG